MNRCPLCRSNQVQSAISEIERRFGKRRIVASVAAERCGACGEERLRAADLQRFELVVAAELARSGARSGDAFRFMRKALGLSAAKLAALLELQPATIASWEADLEQPQVAAAAVLGSLVLDRAEGRTATLDRLEALRSGEERADPVRVAVS